MWKKLMNTLKGGLYRLGLIKGISKITEHKDVPNNEEMFKLIETWANLYKGYHEPFHKVKYHTVDGPKTRKMVSLNMPKTVAAEMASLIFNEKCEISIGDEKLHEEIVNVFKNNNFYKLFQTYLEYSFAHGGMVTKPYVENGEIKISFVTADCFIPLSWRNGMITEAVFPNEFKKRGKKYTHLEWHLWEDDVYVIKNEVYEANENDELGVEVSLEDFFPGLEEQTEVDNLKRPLFNYFKPNTANNKDTKSPLGISIYANALDILKSIDTAFDSFHREFRLGKKRILVPAKFIKTVVDPVTGDLQRYFDTTDETFEAFKTEMDDEQIKDISVELRVEEHVSGINALLNLLAMQTGFSAGAFSFDGKSMKTAREVVSEQSKTFKSKQSHETIIEAGLKELIDSIVAIAKDYKIFNVPDKYDVSISFDDSIAEDKGAEITDQIKMVVGGIQSRRRAIEEVHGVTKDEALKILKEIQEDNPELYPMNMDKNIEKGMFGDEE